MPKFTFRHRGQHHVAEGVDSKDAYKNFRAALAAQAAANKATALAKSAKAMTCQCCGRAIFAETGLIAHHGYQRPGSGWQTSSCYGARHVPFEVSRDALGRMLTMMREQLARNEAYRAAVAAEHEPCRMDVPDKSKPRTRFGSHPDMTVDVTRENYAAFAAANQQAVYSRGLRSFDEVLTRKLASLDSQIRLLTAHINEQQKRFDGWKQTHEWKEGWVKL